MRNGRKWLSVTAALCMVVPSITAFASAVPTTKTLTGEGAIEYDPKVVTPYYHVTLPTVTDETYDFILDPMKTLAEYDKTSYSGSAADPVTAFFTTTGTPSSLEATAASTKVYTYEYTAVASANVQTALNDFLNSGAIQASTTDYYVWTPNKTDLPNGTWVKLDASNVLKYCVPYNASKEVIPEPANGAAYSGIDHLGLNPDCKKDGEEIFDGSLYTLVANAGTELVAGQYDVNDYVTVDDDGNITGIVASSTGLGTSTDNGTTVTKLNDTTVVTALKVKAAETLRTNTSDKAIVINKSSADTDVEVKVTVKNPGTLHFLADSPTSTDLGADVLVQVDGKKGAQGGTLSAETGSPIALQADSNGNVTGTMTVNLPGLSDINKYVAYQGPTISLTGGHEIVRYNQSKMTYQMAEITIHVETNDVSDTSATITDPDDLKTAEAAWGAYIAGLKDATYVKPEIEVVYTLSNPVNGPQEVTAYDPNWSGSTLWFTKDASSGFTDASKLEEISMKQADGTYATTDDAADLAKLTLTNGYFGITWNDLVSLGQNAAGGAVEMKITYDGVVYVING